MRVIVLFTDLSHTCNALRTGHALAYDLGATLEIIAVRALPYPAPLTSEGQASFLHHMRQGLAESNPAVAIRVYYCRDSVQTLFRILPPQAIVVLCWPRTWRSSSLEKLRGMLESAGHHMISA